MSALKREEILAAYRSALSYRHAAMVSQLAFLYPWLRTVETEPDEPAPPAKIDGPYFRVLIGPDIDVEQLAEELSREIAKRRRRA